MPAKLYKLDASPPARAAMMSCEIFNVPVEMIDVDVMKGEHLLPEFLKINSLHTVPVFVDGDVVIQDSHALLMYLAEMYGNNSPMYPNDIKQRVLINQKMFFNIGTLFGRLRSVTYPYFVEGKKGLTKQQQQDIIEAYEFLEEFLSRHKFLALDHITIADIAAYATVSKFDVLVPLNSKYPKFEAWRKEMEKQPYCKKYNAPGCILHAEFLRNII